MEFINFMALIGMAIDDLLAISSIIGSLIMFFVSLFGAKRWRFSEFANWSFLGLVFGSLFQISMAITGTTPEKVGILVPMAPFLVNGLLFISLVLFVGQLWLRRIRKQNKMQSLQK